MKTQIGHIKLEEIAQVLSEIKTDTLLVIVDHQFWSQFSKEILLEKIENKKVIFWKAPDGEKVKNIEEYQRAIDFFLEKGIHRKAHLVVMGGGATSDFAGFVAATILRGISWSVIPTTLLAMVDASIGGKVGINSRLGKNLVGAFHMPENVWICSKFLETLPENEILSGKGEILKYAFLDYSIYDLVIKKTSMEIIIESCARYKEKIVEDDPHELGIRKTLNLGHTFGHAVESIYNIPHGEAVSWGIALILKLFGSEKNINDLSVLKKELGLANGISPWLNKEFPIEKMMNFITKDKKMTFNQTLDLILVKDIGNVVIENLKIEEIGCLLESKKDELKKYTL